MTVSLVIFSGNIFSCSVFLELRAVMSDGVRTVRWTRKVSFIVVQLISLETCHFSFWSASFKLNQLEIL